MAIRYNTRYNARLMIYNDANDAVIEQTIGTAPPLLQPQNLLEYSHSELWRTSDFNQAQLTLKWFEPRIISGVVLSRHNMSKSSTFRVEVFADEAMTDLKYDSIIEHPANIPAVFQKTLGELDWVVDPLVAKAVNTKLQDVEHWFDLTLAKAVRITVFDPDNDHGHIDIARLFVGRALQPKVNFSYDHKAGWRHNTEPKLSAGGSRWGKRTTKKRRFLFSLDWLDESERPHFYNAIHRLDIIDDWYISLFPLRGGQKERHYAMAAMFEELPEFTGYSQDSYKAEHVVVEA